MSYSEMFSIILKVICLFQITKGIYLLNVQNIMSIYGIGHLHISRMELHINIFVEPLITFVPSKHTNRVLDMSVPRSDNTSLILSIITSDFVEEIYCNVRKSRQNNFFFIKITYIYSDHSFPCNRGRFICKQNNILSMASPFVYEFLEVGIQR